MRKFLDSILAQLADVRNWSDEELQRFPSTLKAIDEAVCDLVQLKKDNDDPDVAYMVEEELVDDVVATEGVEHFGGSSHNIPAELSHRIGVYCGRADFMALEQAVECVIATCREDGVAYKMLRKEIED